jgi:hypothetical protein
MAIRNTIVDLQSLRGFLVKHESATTEAVQKAAAEVVSQEPDLNEVQLVASWSVALGKLDDLDDDNNRFSLADPLISRLQTYFAETIPADPTAAAAAVNVLPGDVLEVKFDSLDPTWVADGIGIGLRKLFHVKPTAWVPPLNTPELIPDNYRVAMFGDWGSGLYGAPVISGAIMAADKAFQDGKGFQMVLHLGDTYYAGSQAEVTERLIGDTWPRVPQGVWRSLNGNHEMYWGGAPYFSALRNFFHQSASCFAVQNSKWLLIALDSSYVEGTVEDQKTSQIAWLKGLLSQAGGKKVVLFSHHQPYSQLDRTKNSKKLQDPLRDILASGQIHAWYFGHEHRCVIYDQHPDWGVKGRCIGHGGFPSFRDSFQVETPANVHFYWQRLSSREKDRVPAALVLDGPNEYMDRLDDRDSYSPHGYVTLDFNGDDCLETYYLPNGKVIRPAEKL